jgi:hypothetical protein
MRMKKLQGARHKGGQLFIGTHDETLSSTAMCVSNEDRSPARIHSCNATPTPTSFAEIVSDYFSVVQAPGFCLLRDNDKII